MCKVENCIQAVTCSIGCFSDGIMTPDLLGCIDMCLGGACANALNAANNVINCAVANCLMFGGGGGGDGGGGGGGGGGGVLNCLMMDCPNQLESCFDTSCTEM